MKQLLLRRFLLIGAMVWSAVSTAHACALLPASLQGVPVSHISQAAELQKIDEQLEAHLQPCLVPITPENRKTICAHGRVVAEQALRVVARIDEAGKRNAFLSNAKMKSYKTAVGLLDHMKALVANKTCV